MRVSSNLVWIPALVKTQTGDLVYSLKADDFILTDNGIPQRLRLEEDSDSLPLALEIIVENGAAAMKHLPDYRGLSAVLDGIIGNVDHRVAIISFDDKPRLEQDFTANTDLAADSLASLKPGDDGATIIDALKFGIELLKQQPLQYRRVILLISETSDSGSTTPIGEALRLIGDTNTEIYSFSFSSARSALSREAAKVPRLGGTPYSDIPYPPGGCMAKGGDPDAKGKRSAQFLDCASDLFPPLRLVRAALLAAQSGMERNVPQEVAQLTGGEYFAFKSGRDLRMGLVAIANDVPNHYLLSFEPHDPQPGLHTLNLRIRNRSGDDLKSRTEYWVDTPSESTGGRSGQNLQP